MPPSPDVIIVGLGAVGSASLLSLARRGVRCTGIDRFAPPHDRGSSHGLSRLIRLCYFEHPDYVPLLRESYRLWNLLQRESPGPIIRTTGGLYLGSPSDDFVRGSLASANTHALAHELLDRAQIARRFPQFIVDEGEVAFYEPTAGVLFPENAIAANLRAAASLGAEASLNEQVLGWTAGPGGVEVRTDRRTLHAGSLILAAGAWMPVIMPELRATLTVTRQVLAWFRPRPGTTLFTPGMPAWAVGQPDGSAHYGFPMFPPDAACPSNTPPGGHGFKIAHHKPGDAADPDHVDRTVRPDEVASLAAFLRGRIPAACGDEGELLDAKVCLYTSTPDQHFLVDLHRDHANVVVVSACSGHGFKLSPATGAAAADLATTGRTNLPIGFLRWRQSMR